MSERIITFGEATREAMLEEMRADECVFVYGEDIAKQGGIFGQFAGMKDEFPERVLDTPISETALVGAGIGAAAGPAMRPEKSLVRQMRQPSSSYSSSVRLLLSRISASLLITLVSRGFDIICLLTLFVNQKILLTHTSYFR